MHEVTVRIVNVAKSSKFGLSKIDHGQDYRPRKGPRPAHGSVPVAWWDPAKTVLALLLWVADE